MLKNGSVFYHILFPLRLDDSFFNVVLVICPKLKVEEIFTFCSMKKKRQ